MNKQDKHMVFGASPNPARYSFVATERLVQHGYDVLPVGNRRGKIGNLDIIIEHHSFDNVHTITLYMNPQRQQEHYEYLLGLKPERIIFNPGTENNELIELAEKQGVHCVIACTLVMLSVGSY